MINIIKEIFRDKINNSKKLNAELKRHPEIIEWGKEYLVAHPEYEKVSYLIISLIKNIKLPKCKTCGKTIFYSKLRYNSKYCSNQCSHANLDWRNKFKKKRSKESLDKTKETCLIKYRSKKCKSIKFN